MSCQKRNWNCPRYKQKEDFRQAKRQFPAIESDIEKWECNAEFEKTCKDFQAPPPRMTAEEFHKKSSELLNELPKEFQVFASSYAYDRGHSAGYEEAIGYLSGIVSDLKEPIREYTDRIVAVASNVKSFK